jgi:hypothetical protein
MGSGGTYVIDTATGRERTLASYDGPRVGTLKLAPSGAVAWLTGERPNRELDLWNAGGRTTLDRGDITAFTRRDGMLHWANAGRRHRAALR